MIKRFWPLLTIVIIVILAAIIIPASATLMPKLYLLENGSVSYKTRIALNTSLPNFPDDIKEGEPFEVSGYLYYFDLALLKQHPELDGDELMDFITVLQPLPGRYINLSIRGIPDQQTLLTNEDGYFHTTVQIDDKSILSGWEKDGWIISAYYADEIHTYPYGYYYGYSSGSPLSLPLSVSKYIEEEYPNTHGSTKGHSFRVMFHFWSEEIPKREGKFTVPGDSGGLSINWKIAMIFVIPFIGIITYFIYRYRKKLRAWLKWRKAKGKLEEPVSTKQQLSTVEAVQDVFAGDPRIEILFPQIENPLPLVWGTGEPLTIMGHVLIENAEKEINSKPQIRTEDHSLIITTPDLSPVKIEHSFNIKGETDINVYFGVDTNDKIFGTRKIKIVDYREEIVELFNHLIDSLSAKGIAVNRMMTAREIESKLTGNYSDFSPDTMKDVVKGFEYANYSLHPVARKIYVDMYVAVEKVRERIKNV
jgi:hypothetical protein